MNFLCILLLSLAGLRPTRAFSTSSLSAPLPFSGSILSPVQSNCINQLSTSSRSSRLYSLENSSNNNGSDPGRRNFLRRLRQFWVTRSTRLLTRYQALSKRAKRILIAQCMIVALLFGGVSRSVTRQHVPPPVEIAYSSFLDLVEQQQKQSPASKSENIPVLDQVRIGSDRISYRLYQHRNEQNGEKAASLRAYTRKVPASPELVQTLRDNKITFAASPQPRTSTVALITRTVMVGFYFVILWRLYSTISRSQGGGKGETPGKLAQTSDLPMATFDEIQGIDGAKNEVMELVDTLRNPDKYAILGARAPTGLLLEGPVSADLLLVVA